MTTKARYDIYLKTSGLGIMHAAECVVQEESASVQRVDFRYRSEYLEHSAAFAIDPSQLPLGNDERALICRGGVPAFLDDYLPDNWGRKVLAQMAFYRKQQKFNSNSVIESLELISNSRIGALAIVAQGQVPDYQLGHNASELHKLELAAQQLDSQSLDQMELDEMSLLYFANAGTGVGGARPKALLHDSNGAYIAKFNRLWADNYNNARVELACLNMASAAGLNVGQGKVHEGINGREVLLLDRFDVLPGGDRKHLISVNGLLKEPETQRDYGSAFRYDDVCALLQRYSTSIGADLEQLLRLMLFNRAINNTDDHERNFSVVNAGEGYRLSPAYDMVPSISRGQYHAAGYAYRPYPPTPGEALEFGKIFGLSKPTVAQCAEQVLEAVNHWQTFAGEAGVGGEQIEAIERCFSI
ncbi:MAG: serine/threonine-protein kinase HipA [Halieaceae bacterium]